MDDVRYLTTLLAALGGSAGNFPDQDIIAQTYDWLRKVDVANGDLDDIRRAMAQRIIDLLHLGAPLPPKKVLAGIDTAKVKIVTFGEPWRFKIDLKNEGVKQGHFKRDLDDAKWARIRTDKEEGWDKQGFPGTPGERYFGYGWYRAPLPIDDGDRARRHKYLYFENVDEQGWIYLNGRLIFEQTIESTGMPATQLSVTPFSVSLAGAKLDGKDVLAVRVYSDTGAAGLLKPVHLVLSDQKLSEDQLHTLLKLRSRRQ